MNDDDEDRGKDGELDRWLRGWSAPQAPPSLRERLLASYAGTARRGSAWQRLWAVRLSVPLPVALASVVLFLAVAGLRWHTPRHRTSGQEDAAASIGAGLADLRPLPEVQIRVARRAN